MSKDKNILFCCEAGDHIGGGHLIRCLTLAEALKKKGFECSFLTNEQAWDFPALINSGFRKADKNNFKENEFFTVIFDDYNIDYKTEETFRKYCDYIVIIDDLANRKHDCNLLFDYSPSRQKSDYIDLVPSHTKIHTGLEFFIAREEFFELADVKSNKEKSGSLDIFISMGSIDGRELLPKVVKTLETNSQNFNLHIMVTDKTRTLGELENIALESSRQISVHQNVPNPARLMHQCDLAITAGGITSFELLTLRKPVIAIIVADNQKENINFLNNNNYLQKIDDINDLKNFDFKSFSKKKFDSIHSSGGLKTIEEIVNLENQTSPKETKTAIAK